jgi:DNA polymerase I-like protein with 3'-5' exonuclease and polymerase domains
LKLDTNTATTLTNSTPLIRVGIIPAAEDRKYALLLNPLFQEYNKSHNFILNPEAPCQLYITTCPKFLAEKIGTRKATINDFFGSIIQGSVLVLNPFEHYRTVDTYAFLAKRFLRKLLKPDTFYKAGQFTWQILDRKVDSFKSEAALDFLKTCSLIAADIETPGKELSISCIALAGYNSELNLTKTYVLEFTSLANVLWLRQALGDTEAIKIFQNGQYDITYLLRYSIIPYNYLLDTLGLFHSWYAELPRRLSFIAAFTLQDSEFWKDDKLNDRHEFLRYNARDSFYTLHACISLLLEMPDYVYTNYSHTFPLQFPCLLMGMRGLKVNKEKLVELEVAAREKIESSRARLGVMANNPNFNPGSPKQVKTLFHIYGAKELDSTDTKATVAFSAKHVLNSIIGTQLTTYRENLKFHSNYALVNLLNGRLHYSLNPWGTESGRFSSSGSHFNFNENYGTGRVPSYCSYGFQIQNVPVEAKVFVDADEGFSILEIDYSQAESRTTGYLAQDLSLIDAVENSPDFHSHNASKFFGLDFDYIVAEAKEAKKNHTFSIRDLSKRTNHGANYNMGAFVLISTMGEKNLWRAKDLLKLPLNYDLQQIALHLLIGFCNTYPRLKGTNYVKEKFHTEGVKFLIKDNTYYGEIIQSILDTKKLISPLGYTRYCFSNPMTSKPALNKYVAHPSQNLSVALINRAILRIQSNKELRNENNFRLCAQIHDSLLLQFRTTEIERLLPIVESLMNEPIEVHGRILKIPFEADKPKLTWK